MVDFWLETLSVAVAGSAAIFGMLHVFRGGSLETGGDQSAPHTRVGKLTTINDEAESDIEDFDEDRQFEFCGRHLLGSYSACDPVAIRDQAGLTVAFRAAIRASGATLLHAVEHTFPPHGMTAVAALSESHASIHTYPEHNSCFVDIFTCGDTCCVEAFDEALRKFLRPKVHSCRIIRRHEAMTDESLSEAGPRRRTKL